ncbi:MAG: hypothetical protein C5B50_14370 [Verrucomicrobia bacterium]|nr:MAG: hypothetical protein C5B50_14370 [Verrucomicrobiota bacterium]
MASPPKLEDCRRVLAVEGYSDLHFYAEFLEALGQLEGVFIKQFNGRQDLATKLEDFLTPHLLAVKDAIGVVVDADSNAAKIALELSQLLTSLSGQPVTAGDWTTGEPRIGLFVTPDGHSSGEIESLVWSAWALDPANAKSRQCVESYIACMKAAGFEPRSQDKGLVSALLAVRNDEDPRLGPGARTKKVFDFSRPEYELLRQFLTGF